MFDSIIGDQRPLGWVLGFWPVLASSFLCSLAATLLCKRVAIRLGLVDRPDHLVKTHHEPVAYLGGVAMFVGLVAGVLAGLYLLRADRGFPREIRWFLGILAGAAIACFVGLADDVLDLRPRHKVLGQALAAAVLLLAGVHPNLERIAQTLGLSVSARTETVLDVLIVTFFVLGATNSLNLLDGLDGLCAGVTAIIAAAMLLLATHLATWGVSDLADPVRIVICLGLVGGVCGFLPFNRHPARIFMGDAGSMLLGFVAAALMILFATESPRCWVASIVLFGLPILDTAVAVVRRLLNRRPVFVSDRGHIYDQMIDRGIPLRRTVAICYALAGLYALLGLAMSQIRARYAVVLCVVMVGLSALIVWRKGYLKMHGLRGAVPEKRFEA
ncbi:MAG TPA: MraY family glycosyltransferase [Sedimentisphaerales bacterium]|jgi:UDP-GlcNAc:undecaprenyl-phosphate GlcNAc-1-phosphate transferase|nr:MraY family glycosyltransferase [Sedimentisphaerales bacterium]HNU30348.1 MraY family glycosyltransferase [Sedimentisphaerales bacterium]